MYWLDPQSAAGYNVLGAIVTAAPFVLGQVTGVASLFDSAWLAVISIGLAALIVLLFARQMTCKTVLGARTRVEILGFQEFMNRVDRDRIQRMPPDTFEKFLPYAMALGVEHHWAQAFAGIVRQPPNWYVGPMAPRHVQPRVLRRQHAFHGADRARGVRGRAPRQLHRLRMGRRRFWRRWRLLRRRLRRRRWWRLLRRNGKFAGDAYVDAYKGAV